MKIASLLGLACILQVNHTYEHSQKTVLSANHDHLISEGIFLKSQPADTSIDEALSKLYKHGMPMLLSVAKSILGKDFHINKPTTPVDFTDYVWTTKEGIQFIFEDINYNEKGIELDRLTISSKQIMQHPLGIYLNKSTLPACRKMFPALKKSLDERTYKLNKNKVWYFLEFNKQNVLVKVRSVGWDTDYSG